MRTPIWSFSFLRDYENCEHKAYRRYIVKDVPFEKTPEIEKGNQAHKALEERLTSGYELPDDHASYEHLVAPIDKFDGDKHFEWKLGIKEDGSRCSFFDDDVWGRCIIDVALIRPPVALLLDWKTGKVREDAGELATQAVILKAHRPELSKITGRYVWLKDNKIGESHDLSDTAVKLAAIRGRVEKIRSNMRFGSWHKRENVLCKWCNVIDCEFNRR